MGPSDHMSNRYPVAMTHGPDGRQQTGVDGRPASRVVGRYPQAIP